MHERNQKTGSPTTTCVCVYYTCLFCVSGKRKRAFFLDTEDIDAQQINASLYTEDSRGAREREERKDNMTNNARIL